MKKIITLAAGIFLFTLTAFCQTDQKNGTIYIKHPYIDVVLNSEKDYLNKSPNSMKYFADTARFWTTGMEKPIPISEALKVFAGHFDIYDDIKLQQVGYPDYLHYIDKDSKIVQSWWRWSAKSKKTGNLLNIDFVKFDEFNNAGKIIMETMYGDFSKME